MYVRIYFSVFACFATISTNVWCFERDYGFASDSFFSQLDITPLKELLQEQRLQHPELGGRFDNLFKPATTVQSEHCSNCLFIVDGLQILFRDLEFNYTDIYELSLNICIPYVKTMNFRGDILCPGLLKNYGPNVERIFKAKAFTGEKVCVMNANECTPDEIDQDSPVHNLLREMERRSTVQRRRRPKSTPSQHSTEESQRDPLKILHISDMHIDTRYEPGTAVRCRLPTCCRRGLEGPGKAGRWGSAGCNLGPDLANSILKKLSLLKPDIVLYTGDNSAAANWEESQPFMLNNSIWVAEAIGRAFPGVPAYSILGNHETFPTNLYHSQKAESIELNDVFSGAWGPLSRFTEDQYTSFRSGAYFSVRQRAGLRVIGFNTNFAAVENWYSVLDDPEYPRMLTFLRAALKNASNDGDKVIMVGHHLMGGQGRFQGDDIYNLYVEFSDIIVLSVFGHTHNNQFKVAMDNGVPVGTSYVPGAITTPGSDPNSNNLPNSRMYEMDPDTFEIRDFRAYRTDYKKFDQNEEPSLDLHYFPKESYGLEDLSPVSWYNLTKRFESDANLYAKYLSHRTGAYSKPNPSCKGKCLLRAACTIRAYTITQSRRC